MSPAAPPGSARWVLHLDMDAFFASAEQLTRPTLRARPVLVGGLGPRAVVAGASYQARVFGARSAMPMGQARRLCPHATVLPARFALYQALSEQVMAVLADAAPVVEPVSLDEAFLEPPELAGADAEAVRGFATRLRTAVRTATGLPASVGAGSGKQLAKIASDLAKPDGLRVIEPAEQDAVLGALPVRALWGVGPVHEAALHRLGLRTIGELAGADRREVLGALGVAVGTELHQLARGHDDRPVAPRAAAKQVSAETTFDADLTGMAAVRVEVARIAAAAHRRLLTSGRAARTVTVKIRGADFATSTRSETTSVPGTDLDVLTATAQRLADAAVPAGGVRLIGVSLAGLVDDPPPDLFTVDPPHDPGAVPGAGADDAADTRRAAPETGPGAESDDDPDDRRRVGAPVGSTGPELVAPGPPPDPAGPDAGSGSPAPTDPRYPWRPGDDVHHVDHGHGWVQGAGHGRVTVRFETRSTGPGRALTLTADDPALTPADPLASLQ